VHEDAKDNLIWYSRTVWHSFRFAHTETHISKI